MKLITFFGGEAYVNGIKISILNEIPNKENGFVRDMATINNSIKTLSSFWNP